MELLGPHPNILQIIGSSIHQGVPCLVLPWMENGNIAEYILSGSDVPGAGVCCRKKLVRFFFPSDLWLMNFFFQTQDIARGMVHLKRSGIIHGDLKGVSSTSTSIHIRLLHSLTMSLFHRATSSSTTMGMLS